MRYQNSKVCSETNIQIEYYKENPDSPTVNICWFITKAYLANLYYASHQNYSATEETCNKIIRKQSGINEEFAENSLPVIISTQWTSVYDKELQEMLGLYTLCSFIFYKTDRRRFVYLGVCPVLFAYYLKWPVLLINS